MSAAGELTTTFTCALPVTPLSVAKALTSAEMLVVALGVAVAVKVLV